MTILISAAQIAITILLAILLLRLMERLSGDPDTDGIPVIRQMIKILIVAVAAIAVIIQLPLTDALRGQLLNLMGLAVSAVIALSSTTFVANLMAGFVLRAMGNFKPGDFLHVEEYFGRVTERGLLHTEIQTQDRDLVTMPNLYLVNRPVQVVHESGTIISANISLGYDIHHDTARAALVAAVEQAGLRDGFVRIVELLDHVVVYRVAGFLENTKELLLAKSRLREAMLQHLHEKKIEIASPTLHSVRSTAASMVPETVARAPVQGVDAAPEGLIFDKAESAEAAEAMRTQRAEIQKALDAVSADKALDKGERDSQAQALKDELAAIDEKISRIRERAGIDD